MARVNIEDTLEAHGEFWSLLSLVDGDRDRALGKLVRFFRLAQAHFGRGEPITEEELRQENLLEMIGSRWALPVEGGFECKGGEKHFTWYRQRCDSAVAGGRARAAGRRDDKGRFQPKASHTPAEIQPEPTRAPAESQPDSSPLSPSLSLSLTQIHKEYTSCMGAASQPPIPVGNQSPIKKPKFSEDTRQKMRAFIATYSEGYRKKYGGPPEGIRDKAIVGKLGHWIESVSEQRACELAEIYLQVDYRPINESCHDLWQFFRHLNRIGLALQTGQEPGGIDWSKVFGGSGK